MRIVSLVPSATETLYELGLEDQIVAITRYCVKPADRVKLKPKVGGTKNPVVSEIIALKPDIVIVDVEENREEDAEALQAAGIQLYVTFPKTMRESADMIRDMGKTFGAESRANEIADTIFKQMLKYQSADLRSALIFIWKQPYMTINHDTYVHDVCRFFGFENVFAEAAERYPQLTDQQIREVFP
ncbi:MAG: cobalamin-binding protein, partial [Acidobacteria bacterium]